MLLMFVEGMLVTLKRIGQETLLVCDKVTPDLPIRRGGIAAAWSRTKGAHYLFTVKDNQKTLANDLKAFDWESIPP